jgi:hypothetical protein
VEEIKTGGYAMLVIATRKGAKIMVPGYWATMEATVKCPHPGCKAEYFLGQQQPFKDEKLWPTLIAELSGRLEDEHGNEREHSDKIDLHM